MTREISKAEAGDAQAILRYMLGRKIEEERAKIPRTWSLRWNNPRRRLARKHGERSHGGRMDGIGWRDVSA